LEYVLRRYFCSSTLLFSLGEQEEEEEEEEETVAAWGRL